MDPGVRAAIRLFPRHEKDVKELILASDEFRGLCRDLAEAEEMLRRHAKSNLPDSAARYEEYRTLLGELEAELRQALRDHRSSTEDIG